MKNLQQWLAEYGESHQNHQNKNIHWVCVPLIFFSIVGLLFEIKIPLHINSFQLNLAVIVVLLVTIYYAVLSSTIWIGMLIFGIICILIWHSLELSGFVQLWILSLIIFALAWIGQFYGHKIEGKKPSFLKDIQFLMIGPAWLMSFIYKKMGIKI